VASARVRFNQAAIRALRNEQRESGEQRPAVTETDPQGVELTSAVCAELLDPDSWAGILTLFARTTRLAVALVDAQGQIVGTCHNPQPIWSLARAARTDWGTDCPFCLEPGGNCTAAADALRTNSLVLAHDRAGFAHTASPVSLAGQHLGVLIAGQVFDRFPELLRLDLAAKDFGLSAQEVWHSARQQAPVSRANLTVFGNLLHTLGQSFVRDRYSAILERKLDETTTRLNRELAGINSELTGKVEELDRSNSDLQNLLDSTEIAAIFLNQEMRIKKFTPAAGSLVRLAASDIGRPITELEDRFAAAGLINDIAQIISADSTGFRKEYPIDRERDVTGMDGEHYLMRVFPYRTALKIIDGAVITFVDVTELKQAKLRATAAKIYAENIVATMREPLLVLNNQFLVVSANESFYRTFQVLADDTQGHLLYDLGDGQWDIPELRRLLGEVIRKDQSVQDFEIEHSFAHLGPRTMMLNAHRIDHLDLILVAIDDITERKRAEMLLRRMNDDLKHFSYAASHDMQEPLRMVMTYTELLTLEYQGKLDAKADLFIGYATEGAQRLARLLGDLRQYWLVSERIEHFAAVDCAGVLDGVIQSLRVAIEESGAIVTSGPLPTLLADDISFAMLFQNLVGNAVKYRRPGERPSVHISAQQKADIWCFSVKDNGIGIKTQHLEGIFAPFKRLHGREYAGSGIGLALCHKIVERYGGRLWVESTYGQGSTFCFTISDRRPDL
jgi:signal transduction histidine kinase/ligand-binding sensor protein